VATRRSVCGIRFCVCWDPKSTMCDQAITYSQEAIFSDSFPEGHDTDDKSSLEEYSFNDLTQDAVIDHRDASAAGQGTKGNAGQDASPINCLEVLKPQHDVETTRSPCSRRPDSLTMRFMISPTTAHRVTQRHDSGTPAFPLASQRMWTRVGQLLVATAMLADRPISRTRNFHVGDDDVEGPHDANECSLLSQEATARAQEIHDFCVAATFQSETEEDVGSSVVASEDESVGSNGSVDSVERVPRSPPSLDASTPPPLGTKSTAVQIAETPEKEFVPITNTPEGSSPKAAASSVSTRLPRKSQRGRTAKRRVTLEECSSPASVSPLDKPQRMKPCSPTPSSKIKRKLSKAESVHPPLKKRVSRRGRKACAHTPTHGAGITCSKKNAFSICSACSIPIRFCARCQLWHSKDNFSRDHKLYC